MIPLLFRLLVFALFAAVAVYLVRALFSATQPTQGAGSAPKCSGCRHFRGAEDDGVFCGSGDFETYKTFADVEKCLDYARPG